ncbi:hypothetical protein EDB83DRAFT_2324679 [Lactarius deliciosus]|nr:hypothetical protein EDB83DRAFT_2324679 [Lactarius deliciosus]
MGKSHQGTSTTVMVAVAVAVVIGSWGRDHIVPHRMEDHKGLEALAHRVGTCVVGLMHAPGVVEWFGAGRGGNKAMAAAVSVQQAGGGGSRGWQCCAVSCNS